MNTKDIKALADELRDEAQRQTGSSYADEVRDLLERAAAALSPQADEVRGEVVAWQPMETAPDDGTMLRLLVDFTEHSTEDNIRAVTIGAYAAEGDPAGAWQFAGWCWTHDHFTEGKGTPVGWMPLLDDTTPQPQGDASPQVSGGGEVFRALVAKWREQGQREHELSQDKEWSEWVRDRHHGASGAFSQCVLELEAALAPQQPEKGEG